MTWADFYLICFVVGFAFSFLSFIVGGLHLHAPHLPHGIGHVGLGNGMAAGNAGATGHVAGNAPAAHAHAGANGGNGRATAQVSPFNFFTIPVFLAWFGGTGFLFTRYSTLGFLFGLSLAIVAGLIGATAVFLFMSKFLMGREKALDPADFEMVGVLGKISSSIREGGTGEITYSQEGTRRACGARSEDGTAIAKGEEIVVTRYEKGIAYVRRWEELTADEDSYGTTASKP
jgi:membrane protein implicated in regulation of membrane protease activity